MIVKSFAVPRLAAPRRRQLFWEGRKWYWPAQNHYNAKTTCERWVVGWRFDKYCFSLKEYWTPFSDRNFIFIVFGLMTLDPFGIGLYSQCNTLRVKLLHRKRKLTICPGAGAYKLALIIRAVKCLLPCWSFLFSSTLLACFASSNLLFVTVTVL